MQTFNMHLKCNDEPASSTATSYTLIHIAYKHLIKAENTDSIVNQTDVTTQS